MENASKALLMAGGMLLVMLIVGLLIFARSRIGDFYNQEKDLSEIKDLSEFNSEFSNYERDDVYGYELLSLANRVADYNNRFSSVTNAQNDLKFNPIKINIYMNKANMKNIMFGDTNELFFPGVYTTDSVNSRFSTIINKMTKNEDKYGKENLQNLCKSLKEIYLADTTDFESKKTVVSKFNAITLKKKVKKVDGADETIFFNTVNNCDYSNESDVENKYKMIQNNNGLRKAAYEYYEYTQFKKAIFICKKEKTTYDPTTGRVNYMEFELTEEME